MPTDTFYKLSLEKKDKVINAAKKEFARVIFSETSIKNIAEEAGISRGSFYQYFESKEDLLSFILEQKSKHIKDNLDQLLDEFNGDIFEIYKGLFEQVTSVDFCKEDLDMMKMIFNHIRICDENLIKIDLFQNSKFDNEEDYYKKIVKKIDFNKLKIDNKKDLMILFRILNGFTKKSIYQFFNNEEKKDKEKAKKEFNRAIDLMKMAFMVS